MTDSLVGVRTAVTQQGGSSYHGAMIPVLDLVMRVLPMLAASRITAANVVRRAVWTLEW